MANKVKTVISKLKTRLSGNNRIKGGNFTRAGRFDESPYGKGGRIKKQKTV